MKKQKIDLFSSLSKYAPRNLLIETFIKVKQHAGITYEKVVRTMARRVNSDAESREMKRAFQS